jgi:hypothetical protein
VPVPVPSHQASWTTEVVDVSPRSGRHATPARPSRAKDAGCQDSASEAERCTSEALAGGIGRPLLSVGMPPKCSPGVSHHGVSERARGMLPEGGADGAVDSLAAPRCWRRCVCCAPARPPATRARSPTPG